MNYLCNFGSTRSPIWWADQSRTAEKWRMVVATAPRLSCSLLLFGVQLLWGLMRCYRNAQWPTAKSGQFRNSSQIEHKWKNLASHSTVQLCKGLSPQIGRSDSLNISPILQYGPLGATAWSIFQVFEYICWNLLCVSNRSLPCFYCKTNEPVKSIFLASKCIQGALEPWGVSFCDMMNTNITSVSNNAISALV